jgi:hypothetical protein
MNNKTNIKKEGTNLKTKLIGYWVNTIILALALLSGGVAELAQRRETVEGMVHLGYPVYFIMILGVWKVFGALALLTPRFPRLKEWAYAGVFFNMTGAAVSHAVTGDGVAHLIAPLLLAILAVVSWALRSQSRTVGVVFPNKLPRRQEAVFAERVC